MASCICLLSLSAIIWRFTQGVKFVSSSFVSVAEQYFIVWIFHSLFIHSLSHGYVDCVPFLAPSHQAIMKIEYESLCGRVYNAWEWDLCSSFSVRLRCLVSVGKKENSCVFSFTHVLSLFSLPLSCLYFVVLCHWHACGLSICALASLWEAGQGLALSRRPVVTVSFRDFLLV